MHHRVAVPACRLRGSEFFTAGGAVPLRRTRSARRSTQGCKKSWVPFLRCQRRLVNLCGLRGLEGCLRGVGGPCVGAGGMKASRTPPACATDPVSCPSLRYGSPGAPDPNTSCSRPLVSSASPSWRLDFALSFSYAVPPPQTGGQDGPSPAQTHSASPAAQGYLLHLRQNLPFAPQLRPCMNPAPPEISRNLLEKS